MINPKIKTLTTECERYLWYIKTGCVIEPKEYNNNDKAIINLQNNGIQGIRRDHDFGIIKIDGIAKIENEWQLINFSGNEAEIQIGLKLSNLKKCYRYGEYDEQKADYYINRYNRTDLPEKSENCKKQCVAFSFCQQRKIPKPSKHNCGDDGRSDLYKSEFFNEKLDYFNKKFNGNMYENFINGKESFSGLPAFTSKQIFDQFCTFDDFEKYLQAKNT